MLIQLHEILDIAWCYEILRITRQEDGVTCPTCGSKEIIRNGKNPEGSTFFTDEYNIYNKRSRPRGGYTISEKEEKGFCTKHFIFC